MSEKKGKKLGKFVIWVTVIMFVSLLAAGILIGANHKYIFDRMDDRGHEKNVDESIKKSLTGIKNVVIDTVSSDIKLFDTDNDEITVKLYGTAYSINESNIPILDVRVEDDNIYIEVKRPKTRIFWFGSFSENVKLDIYLPKGYDNNLSINTVSSDVYLSEHDLYELKIKTVSGDISLYKIGSNDTDLESVSGNVKIKGEVGKTRIKTISGDVDIESSILRGDINAKTTSGDLECELPNDKAGFSIEFSSVSGGFRSDFDGLEYKGSNNKKFSGEYGEGRYNIDVSTVSGGMYIN